MGTFEHRETTVSGRGWRVAIVASRFNPEVVDALLAGAEECFRSHGVEPRDLEVVRVPGAWEIPLALDRLAATGAYDALVALGAVIRGETPHFDFVAGECSRRSSEVALRRGIPVGFGLLTCDDAEQARARAGGDRGNKGWEAALAALEMVAVVRDIGGAG